MGPIELLKSQHAQIKELCATIPRAEGRERISLCVKLAEELTVHVQLEETVFYPEARARGLDDLVEKSVFEHDEVKQLVALLLELKTQDPRLLETVARIEFLVGKHMEEEERVVFPRFEAHAAMDRMATLGAQMLRTEGDLRSRDVLEIAESVTPMPQA